MESNAPPLQSLVPSGFLLAPIDAAAETAPLRLCVLLRTEPHPATGPFVLLRELPEARVYLGVIADVAGRIQEWVEVWVQTVALRDLTFSGSQEVLSNHIFDQRWQDECERTLAQLPDLTIVSGMELRHPQPVLITRAASQAASSPFAPVQPAGWQLCRDDALLDSFGLPPYSTSPYRYLHQPEATGPKTFLATAADDPTNSHVQSLDRLKTDAEAVEVFNPQAGLIRILRFSPLNSEDYFQILEGHPWEGLVPGVGRVFPSSTYAALQAWSGSPKGMPFLLHGAGTPAERLNEVFFLKLTALLSMFKEVRAYAKARQLPLLNLSPSSFRLELSETSEQFPALWSAKCVLVRPGQAYPLKIKSTEQKYFVRLGKIEPSPFLPEGLGAHSFGIGSVRRRNVLAEADGTVLEGTLVAEDYLGLDPHDLLWFKLPIGEERFEFYAHVYTAEALGPREARFRTVPMKLPEPVLETIKNTAAFAKAPYEIWPLLSSPCDLHSLGIIGIRLLLANSQTNFPVTVDDVLGLARYVGKDPEKSGNVAAKLRAVLQREERLLDLVSPQALVERTWTPQQARSEISQELWLETVAWLLRLFPGAGWQSYCKSFGDVSPLALETVFNQPIQELEHLVLRLRSVLAPTTIAHEEIASAILEQMASL